MVKKIVLLTLLISLLSVFSTQANEFRPAPGFMPDTGDVEFDQFLVRLNTGARERINPYIADLSTAFHIPAEKINRLMRKRRMAPADVLLVLQLVKMTGAPQKRILQRYRQLHSKGWRTIFLAFEIHPGSRFFLLLRQEMPTVVVRYAKRWEKGSKKKRGSKRKGSKGKGSKGKGSKRR